MIKVDEYITDKGTVFRKGAKLRINSTNYTKDSDIPSASNNFEKDFITVDGMGNFGEDGWTDLGLVVWGRDGGSWHPKDLRVPEGCTSINATLKPI